jgi:hypothetical protein
MNFPDSYVDPASYAFFAIAPPKFLKKESGDLRLGT